MKKLISIDHLQVGMFLDAEAVGEVKDGVELKYLSAVNAIGGGTGKRARLTGRMNERVERDGGLHIGSEGMVSSLKSTGLSMVTIDTDKGQDLPENVKPLTDPNRKPPPEGRLVHYDEEIEKAKEVREETADALKTALTDVAEGKDMDVERVQEAGTVISESILRNVDAMVSLTRIKKHDPYTVDSRKPIVALLTQPSKKPRGVPYIVSLAVRSQANGREITRCLDPEKMKIDIEKIMADVAERGERTERMQR